MVLDLNGHLISSDTMVIVSRCDLTIKDSVGTGKVLMDTSDSSTSAFEAVVNQRKLTIESGTYEAKVHSTSSTTGVIGSAVAGVETVVEGGSFIGSGSAINVKSGTTTINGGNFQAANYGIVARGTAVVNFPADTKAEVSSTKFPIVVGTQSGNTGKVNIEGGRFDGTAGSALVGRIGEVDVTQAVTIEGGTFTQDPANYTGTTPVTQIGEPFVVGEKLINDVVKEVASGASVKVVKGNIDLINVPDGVIVENQGNGDVTVNGESVAPSESYTAHTHIWGEPTYTWSADYTACTAQRVCVKDKSHVETAIASVTSEVTKAPTCIEKGVTTYTAKVTFDGKDYTVTKEVVNIPVVGHQFENGVCTVCGIADTNKENTNVPQTGEDVNNVLWFGLALVSAGVLSAVLLYKRKSGKTER